MGSGYTKKDEGFMRRALALAPRGQGHVEPNPMVGCVLVRGGRLVGEGYHRRFGGPHAEIEALRHAGGAARGATAYVTLEPCCHFGKTPPCSEALIAAGIKRVIAAMADPFAKVAGGGLRQLRKAGIRVDLGLCADEAAALNAPYLKRQLTGRPWVILKWAQSLDGCIATRTGDSKWISGERSRRQAHALRGRVDAILVGVGTVLADNPELTCRHVKARRVATRIVLDPHLRTPLRARLVQSARETPTILVVDPATLRAQRPPSSARQRQAKALERRGVELLPVPCTRTGLKLGVLLDELGRRGMTNVLVEGGGRTLGAFCDAGLADEAVIFVARRLMGGAGARHALEGRGAGMMKDLRTPVQTTLTRSGEDDCYRLLFSTPGAWQTVAKGDRHLAEPHF